MIRSLALALWICLVIVVACYGAISTGLLQKLQGNGRLAANDQNLETVRTRQISIPLITNGTVAGYILIRFAATYSVTRSKELPMGLEAVLIDEAHNVIPAMAATEIVAGEARQLQATAARIMERVNSRFGGKLINSLLVQEFAYADTKSARR